MLLFLYIYYFICRSRYFSSCDIFVMKFRVTNQHMWNQKNNCRILLGKCNQFSCGVHTMGVQCPKNRLYNVYQVNRKVTNTTYRYCLRKTEGGQNWYQSIRKDKLYCKQLSFTMAQWTPSQEFHKRFRWIYYFLMPSQPVRSVNTTTQD